MKKFFAMILTAALLVPALGLAAPLMAGTGKVDITPPVGTPLAGYGDRINKPSIGVHDPVFARALVMESGGKRVAMVSADLLIVTRELKADLTKRVADLDLDFISLSVTHTHYSIGAYVDNRVAEIAVMGKYDPKVYEMVVSGLEKALRAAAAQLKPAQAGSAEAPCPALSHNRRHKNGPIDPAIRVFAIYDSSGAPMAVLINHAIHPTTMPSQTLEVTGDVAGRTESWFEEKYQGAIAMFFNAGLGDQSPGGPGMHDGWDAVEKVGVGMAESAQKAMDKIKPARDIDLQYYTRDFPMPHYEMRKSMECWFGLNQLFPLLGKDMLRTEGEVSGLKVNDALFLFSPAEITYDIQKDLEESFPDMNVFVTSHSNDYWGYLVEPDDYKTGGYETCMNFYGPDFAPYLEEQFKKMIAGPGSG